MSPTEPWQTQVRMVVDIIIRLSPHQPIKVKISSVQNAVSTSNLVNITDEQHSTLCSVGCSLMTAGLTGSYGNWAGTTRRSTSKFKTQVWNLHHFVHPTGKLSYSQLNHHWVWCDKKWLSFIHLFFYSVKSPTLLQFSAQKVPTEDFPLDCLLHTTTETTKLDFHHFLFAVENHLEDAKFKEGRF